MNDEPFGRVWSLATGKQLFTLPEKIERGVFSFSSNGNLIISTTEDDTVKVWNSNNGELLYSLSGHSNSITSLVVSHDNSTLFSSSVDRTIKIWNLNTGDLVETLIGHSCAVKDVYLSMNGKILASIDVEGTVKIWKLEIKADTKTASISSTLSDVCVEKGRQLQESGDQQGAISEYSHALEADSTHANAYMLRGISYMTLGHFAKAKEDVDCAFKFDPNLSKRFLEQFNQNLSQEEHKSSSSNLAESLMQLGAVYYEIGDYQEAIENYNYAIKLEPSNTLIYNKLSTARSALKDYQGAIDDLQKAMNPGVLQNNVCNNFLNYLNALAHISETIEKLAAIEPEIASAFQQGFLNDSLS